MLWLLKSSDWQQPNRVAKKRYIMGKMVSHYLENCFLMLHLKLKMEHLKKDLMFVLLTKYKKCVIIPKKILLNLKKIYSKMITKKMFKRLINYKFLIMNKSNSSSK